MTTETPNAPDNLAPSPEEPKRDAAQMPAAPTDNAADVNRSIKEWGKSLVITLIAVLVIKAFVVEAYVVRGASMEPTLKDGERLLLEKVSKRLGGFARGDIIVFRYPEDPSKLFIKRIIALPGDTFCIKGDRVYVNGQELKEDYVPKAFHGFDVVTPTVIPEGHYFVMGDHRTDSLDSRRWGTVDEGKIIGKALVRFWPITRAHPL